MGICSRQSEVVFKTETLHTKCCIYFYLQSCTAIITLFMLQLNRKYAEYRDFEFIQDLIDQNHAYKLHL